MTKQLDLFKQQKKHGGFRNGAGRKKSERRSHIKRENIGREHPLHVTVRMAKGLPNLRRKEFYQAFRFASLKSKSKGLRLLQFSILSNHIHMLVEVENNDILHRGLKSLNTSFAKRVNAILRRGGAVLHERFHMHILKTPAEMKNALKYVLLNMAHHSKKVAVDLYSSAMTFTDLDILLGKDFKKTAMIPIDFHLRTIPVLDDMLSHPRFWLSRVGWQRVASSQP